MPAGLRRQVQLHRMITGSWVGQAVSTAALLGVADAIGDSSRSAADIARAVGATEDGIYRLLRALAAQGLFKERRPGEFSVTSLGRLLQSDHPDSLRAWAAYNGETWHWRAWGELAQSVRTGEPGLARATGAGLFDYLASHGDAAAAFDAAMASLSNVRSRALISSLALHDASSVVDIGGGDGRLIRAIVEAYPHLRGTVYDLPPVVERARAAASGEAATERYAFTAGSFFEHVPPGADVYLLKQVLHDWDDVRATHILRNCRAAMGPGARLLIIELVVEESAAGAMAALSDLEMLALTGGRERTIDQYRALLGNAGLRLARVRRTYSPFTIVEARAG